MKFLAVILSVYVFLLTTLPCADGLAENLVNKAEAVHHSSAGQHHACDHCSPFCTCDCCASPVIAQANFVNFESSSISEKFITVYTSDYHSSSHFFIWHPPKIS
jgi:hypothetical protein